MFLDKELWLEVYPDYDIVNPVRNFRGALNRAGII
jgi:hypothetical protein